MVTFRRQDTGQPLHAGHGDGGNELSLTFGNASARTASTAYRFDLDDVPELWRLLNRTWAELNS